MERVLLTRMESGDQGTFGRITGPGFSLFTGELPWRENQANRSCIPAGLYSCSWTYSTHLGRHAYLIEVLGRAGVRMHPANLMGDSAAGFKAQLEGCVALGEKIGWMDGQKALLVSAPAVRRFEELMDRKPFELEVTDGLAR